MSPLFYADAMGYFKDEGLKVELKYMPNPGDGLTALTSGVTHIAHVPFTNSIVAAYNGAPVKIIGGSGAGGLFLIAQGATGIKSMDDLKKAKGKGLKIGSMRLNTFELMAYRALVNNGLKYEDFQMVWFNDVLSMAAAFESKAVDVVTHVEPFATRLVDKLGGVPIASNPDVWGKDGPDCVTNARVDFLAKYPRRDQEVPEGAAQGRRGDQGRPAQGGGHPRQGQVLPRRQGNAHGLAAAPAAASRPHARRREGHGDRDRRHGHARLSQEGAGRRDRLPPPAGVDEGLTSCRRKPGSNDGVGAALGAGFRKRRRGHTMEAWEVGQPVGPAPASEGEAAAAAQRSARVRRRLGLLVAALLPWVVLISLWELGAARGWITTSLFPPPSQFIRFAIESDFRVGFGREAHADPYAILASAWRVLAGLALGFVAAVATGILVSMSRIASAAVLPIVRGLAPIAPIAWIPLAIVLFGIGEATAIFVVFTGIYFLLTLSTVAAVQSVDPRLIKTARTYGASPRQVWQWVIFPAVLPQVFTMLRINFFAAWMAVLAAEMVGLKNGVGMIIILGREVFNPNLILLGICIVGITGYCVDLALVWIQRKILWWSDRG